MSQQNRAEQALDPQADVPLYQQVVEVLRKNIVEGVYPVGSQLPTEGKLSEQFGVSRHTIREALRRLRDEELLSSRQGAGTIVTFSAGKKVYSQRVDSIEDLIQYAQTIRYHVESSGLVTCDQALADDLGTEVGTQWLRIDGLRYNESGKTAVCKTTVYVRAEYAGVGRMVARGQTAIYEMIEDLYGERISEVQQAFRGLEATKAMAADLGLSSGDPLVEIKRSYYTSSKKLAEVAINLYPLKVFEYSMTLARR